MEHPLKQIGEFGLIERIQEWFDEYPEASEPGEQDKIGDQNKDSNQDKVGDHNKDSNQDKVGNQHKDSVTAIDTPSKPDVSASSASKELPSSLGIGDDCAVIRRDQNHLELVTTDLLIEETHFLMDKISPEDLGHKSLAVNLSDIAAMGGVPRYAWLSIGLTERTDLPWLERFFSAMKKLAHRHGVRLLGGDTTRSRKHLIINLLVTGESTDGQIKYRSGARSGDVVFVTGHLGDSGGGLQLLLADRYQTNDPAEQKLIRAHNRPDADVDEGQWLGRNSAIHALIDLSDGIASDAGHIANRSNVVVALELTRIPISKELHLVAEKYGWDAVQLACTAGEDYALLGTCDPLEWPSLRKNFFQEFGSELHEVGIVQEKRDRETTKKHMASGSGTRPRKHESLQEGGEVIWLENGKPIDVTKRGYDHFKT